VKVSLRTRLVGLWLLIVVICLSLAVLMVGLFRLGVGAEIKSVQAEVTKADQAMQQRFAVYLASYNPPPKSFTDEQRRRELRLIVELVLEDYKGVEGGFWSERGGLILCVRPVSADSGFVAWTMSRAHVSAGAAYQIPAGAPNPPQSPPPPSPKGRQWPRHNPGQFPTRGRAVNGGKFPLSAQPDRRQPVVYGWNAP